MFSQINHIKTFGMVTLLALLAASPSFALKELEIGKKAPEFPVALTDTKGVKHTLGEYTKKGKVVVLEWLNFGCPYVQKHYKENEKHVRNMPSLQAKYTSTGKVIWLSIVSSAPGEEGYLDITSEKARAKANAEIQENGSKATAVLVDADGQTGTLYAAQHTPTMYVIDKKGMLAYQGAIDSNKSYDMKALEGAQVYVADALDAVLADKPVKEPYKPAYGCSVKYKQSKP